MMNNFWEWEYGSLASFLQGGQEEAIYGIIINLQAVPRRIEENYMDELCAGEWMKGRMLLIGRLTRLSVVPCKYSGITAAGAAIFYILMSF